MRSPGASWPDGGIATALALAICAAMGLWPQTMSTLALVVAATLIALAFSLPLGVLAGLMPRLDRVLTPVLDLVQTLPPISTCCPPSRFWAMARRRRWWRR